MVHVVVVVVIVVNDGKKSIFINGRLVGRVLKASGEGVSFRFPTKMPKMSSQISDDSRS